MEHGQISRHLGRLQYGSRVKPHLNFLSIACSELFVKIILQRRHIQSIDSIDPRQDLSYLPTWLLMRMIPQATMAKTTLPLTSPLDMPAQTQPVTMSATWVAILPGSMLNRLPRLRFLGAKSATDICRCSSNSTPTFNNTSLTMSDASTCCVAGRKHVQRRSVV